MVRMMYALLPRLLAGEVNKLVRLFCTLARQVEKLVRFWHGGT